MKRDRIKVSTNVAIAAGVGGRRGRQMRRRKKRREAHALRASTWRVNVGSGQVIARLKLRTVLVRAVPARGEVRHG